MLIDFKCSNFYSFNNEVLFTTLASDSINSDSVERVFECHSQKFNKVSSLYGKNGSGKTTFIGALSVMKNMVIHSSKDSQKGEEIDVVPFAFSNNSTNQPSSFEVTFFLEDSIFRYGFKTTTNKILEEYLYGRFKKNNKNISKRETRLFFRYNNKTELGRMFSSINKFLNSPEIELRDNALLLSYSSQMGHSLAKSIVEWFTKIKFMDGGNLNNSFTASVLENRDNELNNDVLLFLLTSDLGFNNIIAREIERDTNDFYKDLPEELRQIIVEKEGNKIKLHDIKTQHTFIDENGVEIIRPLSLEDESRGANRIFSLAGPIFDCLSNGYVLVMDEIETSLHYLLTKRIINLFNSIRNNNGAQLFFTTHSPLLMDIDILNRDQMWIVSINKSGATEFNRLSDKKYKVRKDTNTVQKIINGEYDSAPNLEID